MSFFAVGIWRPKHEVNVGSLWRSAHLFGAAFVFTVGRRYARQASDTTRTPYVIPLLHFTDVDDLVRHLPHSCPLVGVELNSRAAPLNKFRHTHRAAYLLGAEDHGLSPTVLDRCHYLVQVEAPSPVSMNVACAGTVLLYDRYIKTSESLLQETHEAASSSNSDHLCSHRNYVRTSHCSSTLPKVVNTD